MPVYSEKKHLHDMALCHIACFPTSLSSRLGAAYVQKTLEWFLNNSNRFLFHVEADGKIAGYCGGFAPQIIGDGSSSGMLQYAFAEALTGLLTHPWLLFHKEIRQQYRFLWLNIKRKITGKVIPIGNPAPTQQQPSHVSLVVIGVHPLYRGTGIAQDLAFEFEKKASGYSRSKLVLSVKTDNERAISAYKKFGWSIMDEIRNTYIMSKTI